MDPMILFEAISYMDDRDILSAWEPVPRRRAILCLLVRALLAALLAALLLCTPVRLPGHTLKKASDSQQRSSVDRAHQASFSPETGGYLSYDRSGDSPAALESAAWADYCRAYLKEDYEDDPAWYQGNEALEADRTIYGAYTLEMAEKIFEIRDQFAVRLHSTEWGLQGAESLYQAAGTPGGRIRPAVTPWDL